MEINGATSIYGIMGNPVAHSLSPAMHNGAFRSLGLNNVYLPFRVTNVEDALKGFKALNVKGVSVTIPHKQAVIPYLDTLDPVAEKIGSVNTLTIKDGFIHGSNTDWLGANKALENISAPAGKKVLILGAGGSARAIGFGLLEAGASIALASRTPEKGKALASQLGCQWHPLEQADGLAADILVNATSVGMTPNSSNAPIEKKGLARFQVVMDIVYAPLETRLLREAREMGCTVINGLEMLLYQGVAQFELWTGVKAPVDLMRQTLLTALNTR